MDTVYQQVRRARRRLILQSLAVRLAWFWTAALAAATVAIAILKAWPGGEESGRWAIGTVATALAVSTLAAMIWVWRHRPSTLQVAVEIDRRYGLKERVSSCLALDAEGRDSPIGLALVQDTQRRVGQLDMAEQFGFGLDSRALMPLAPAAAALALAVLVTGRSSDAAIDLAAVDHVRTPARALVQKLAERRKEAAEKGLREADLVLTQLEVATQAMVEKKDGDHKQTLLALNDLVKTADLRRQQLASPAELKQQFARLKNFEHGPGDKLAGALKSGDLQKAVQELDALKRQLEGEQLDSKSREALSRQLEQVRGALEKEAADHQQARAAIGRQIEAQRRAGNAQAAERLQRQLDKLNDLAPRVERSKQMAEQLGQAAGAVGQGEQKQAAAALSALGDQLRNMKEQLAERDLLDGAMAQVNDCKSAMACRECEGQGCAACQTAGADKRGRCAIGRARSLGPGRGLAPGRGNAERRPVLRLASQAGCGGRLGRRDRPGRGSQPQGASAGTNSRAIHQGRTTSGRSAQWPAVAAGLSQTRPGVLRFPAGGSAQVAEWPTSFAFRISFAAGNGCSDRKRFQNVQRQGRIGIGDNKVFHWKSVAHISSQVSSAMIWQSLATIALAVAASTPSDVLEKRNPDGTVRKRTEVRVTERGESIPHGKQTFFFPDGKPSKEVHYVDGMKDGPWIEWFFNGARIAEGNYRQDLKHGLETRYLARGLKISDTNYENGERHGKHIEWFAENQKSKEADYEHGQLHGDVIEWYVGGQQQKSLTRYAHGEKHGPEIRWYPNGQKQFEAENVHDKKNGPVTEWFTAGKEKLTLAYRDGKRQGMMVQWYPNGNKQMEGEFVDGKQQGVWQEWFDDQSKAAVSKWEAGQREGLQTYWHRNGQKTVRVHVTAMGLREGTLCRLVRERATAQQRERTSPTSSTARSSRGTRTASPPR